MALKKIDSNSIDTVINEPSVLVFSRESCHVCQEVVPKLEDISEKYEGKVSFCYVDVEEDMSVLKKFSLKGVPQILFFKDGEFYGKLAGNVEEENIEEKIEELL